MLTQEQAETVLREATEDDHPALLALEGSSSHTGAELLQARNDFFARTDAYPISQVLVAERDGAIIGVECLALSDVRVNGTTCAAGYSFNTRVLPGLQRKGLGPALLSAAERWAEAQDAAYLTGLIKTTNAPSMKMVTALGFQTVARFDYLVLELARFDGIASPRAVRFDLYKDPHLLELRMAAVRSHHFVPVFLEKELFSPAPEGMYAGSWTANTRHGAAWLSIRDDRVSRGLDPASFRAVKAFDLLLEGSEALKAFAGLVGVLRAGGIRHLLIPLPAESHACALLSPFAAEVVDMNFVVKRLGDSLPVAPGPIYFDIRH
ncbi:MAG TPA: GNAT family N-acetyltransferase [Methylomirabilota bacterium]